jgi:hypothetical protein
MAVDDAGEPQFPDDLAQSFAFVRSASSIALSTLRSSRRVEANDVPRQIK